MCFVFAAEKKRERERILTECYIGDDSLKRVLKQSLKNNTMLQMRVPREQDLLSVSFFENCMISEKGAKWVSFIVWLYR